MHEIRQRYDSQFYEIGKEQKFSDLGKSNNVIPSCVKEVKKYVIILLK